MPQVARRTNSQEGFAVLGTLLFIILVVIVLAALLGAGSYSVRRYWSPAGTEVVETSGDASGAGAGIAAALIALLVLVLLFFGFTRWNWFGNGVPSGQSNTPVVTSPAASPSSGGSSPSSSPAASPS
jgi:hypothetical protein